MGVFRTRTLQQKPEEQRLGLESVEMVYGAYWRTTPEQDKEDDEGFTPDVVIRI